MYYKSDNRKSTFKNEFSWSKSRDELFRQCHRKYYYDKYAYWGGWDPNSPTEIRELYILKNLKSRYQWKGERVHWIVSEVLKRLRLGRATTLEECIPELKNRMRLEYRLSLDGQYRTAPKKVLGLFEHEYKVKVTDDEWKGLYNDAEHCLRRFFETDYLSQLSDLDSSMWIDIEELRDFDFEGTKVFVKLDLAYKDSEGKINVVDWKTGKGSDSDNMIQMGCYAIYLCKKQHIDIANLQNVVFNLNNLKRNTYDLNKDNISFVSSHIRSSIALMKEVLTDEENNIAEKERFSCTDNISVCRLCNYKKICEGANI